jgi:hypothetical protein
MTGFVEDSLERSKAKTTAEGGKSPIPDHHQDSAIKELSEKVTWLEFHRELNRINDVLEPLAQ